MLALILFFSLSYLSMKTMLKNILMVSLSVFFYLYTAQPVYGRNDVLSKQNLTDRTVPVNTYPSVVFQEAHQLYLAGRALRDTLDMHTALIRLGRLYLDKYDPDEALSYFNRSFEMVKKHPGFVCLEGESQYYIGLCYYNKHAYNLAANWWNNGKKLLAYQNCSLVYARILAAEADYHLLSGRFLQAKENLDEALQMITKNTDPELSVQIYTTLGQVYHRLGDYNSSIISFHKAIDVSYLFNNKNLLPLPLIHLAFTQCFYNEFDLAAENLTMALDIAEKNEDYNAMGMTFSIMGIVEFIFQNHTQGIEYCNRALDLFNKTDNRVWKAQTHEHLFLLYMGLHDLISAEKEALETLEIRQQIKSDFSLGESYENLGILYLAMEQYENAKSANLKSLELRSKIKYRNGIASSLHKMGRTYFMLGEMDSAMFYLNKAHAIADSLDVKRGKAAILFSMSQVQESLGNTEEAYAIYKNYSALKDTIFNLSQIRKIEGFKKGLDIKSREKMISEQARRITLQQILLAGFTLMLTLVIILAWRLLLVTRKVRKSYQDLSERDALIHTYSNTVIRDKQEAERQIEILDKTLFNLDRTEKQLNWLFRFSNAGMAVVNRDDVLVKVNKYLADSLNYSVSELTGNSWEKICAPEDYKLEKEFLSNTVKTDHHTFTLEVTLIRKNGSGLKNRMFAHVFNDVNGNFEYSVFLFQDISHQRFFDSKMLFHQKYLKRLLYLMTLEVENLAQNVRQLKNLTYVENQATLLEQITRDIHNSLNMVDKVRLLQESLILEQGERFIDLAEIAKVSALDFPESSIRVTGQGIAFADKSVHHVFHHLIRNAIYHGHAGKININIRKSGEYVQVMIVDDGRGITDKERTDVLHAYIHPERSSYTGIGLYWVRQYVESHGGGLKIQRGKEKGTVVILLFLSKDSVKVPL